MRVGKKNRQDYGAPFVKKMIYLNFVIFFRYLLNKVFWYDIIRQWFDIINVDFKSCVYDLI